MHFSRAWQRPLVIAATLAGCHLHSGSHVDGGILGRVVVYRNGVAFYERHATVEDGKLIVHVPRDRVDDFLKSLTVIDPNTHTPLSVTIPRKEAESGSFLTMTVETALPQHADVVLTYVTEAPAWKPSYRVVVGSDGHVMLEGWAIVDNTTSEDWNGVLVGVGASSALAFRYDLWSVRQIDRDLLAGEDKFAIAPPTGMSPYTEASGAEELTQLDSTEVRGDATGVAFTGPAPTSPAKHEASAAGSGIIQGQISDVKTGERLAGVTVVATSPAVDQPQTAITDETGFYRLTDLPHGTYGVTFYYDDATEQHTGIVVADNKVTPIYAKLKAGAAGEAIVVKGHAPTIDPTSTNQAVTIDKDYLKNVPHPGQTFDAVLGSAAGSQNDGLGTSFNGSGSLENQYFVDGVNSTGLAVGSGSSDRPEPPKPPPPIRQGDDKLKAIVAKVMKDKRDVVVEVHGPAGSETGAAARGAAVRNKLVDDGVPAAKIHIVPRLGTNEPETVKVLSVAPNAKLDTGPAPARISPGDTPVGESHFWADRPMTVRSGSSAMVAMLHGPTTGGVVYLYDPISDRGDQRFAFKAVRLDNPTTDTLEPGPVTVYGDGRFIGEGITEPVPPKASVVVPFALDKQILVSHNGSEDDHIAKLVTVQRGIVTAEIQHRKQTRFTVTSRLAVPSTVYLRHRLEPGWVMLDAPDKFTKVGDSQLFELHLEAGETKYMNLVEATPVQRSLELASDEALGMMKLYIDDPAATPAFKAQITELLATHRGAADLIDKLATLRDQLGEFRARSGELHAQIVTLKAVRSGGDLMASLRAKLVETSDRVQKATIAIVEAQEQLMLARVRFQNQLADLKLTDITK